VSQSKDIKDASKTTVIVGMEASFSCNVHIDAGDSKLKIGFWESSIIFLKAKRKIEGCPQSQHVYAPLQSDQIVKKSFLYRFRSGFGSFFVYILGLFHPASFWDSPG